MSEQGSVRNDSLSRRDFLKLLAGGAVVLSFAPFVPWGNFMPNPSSANLKRAKVEYEDGYGNVFHANANTFKTNHSEVTTYPKTGDRVLDGEPFRKWQLIRLPAELGGGANGPDAFRVFSMVCLHLWCLWEYKSAEGRKQGECPCHGSTFDPRSGKAVKGPAAAQNAPSNVLPRLDLEIDRDGFLWFKPPVWGVNNNGIVGYGRLT